MRGKVDNKRSTKDEMLQIKRVDEQVKKQKLEKCQPRRSVKQFCKSEFEQLDAFLVKVNTGRIRPLRFASSFNLEPSATHDIQASICVMLPHMPVATVQTYFAEWNRLIAEKRLQHPFDWPYIDLSDMQGLDRECALLIANQHVRILANLGLLLEDHRVIDTINEVIARLPHVPRALVKRYFAEQDRMLQCSEPFFDSSKVRRIHPSVLAEIEKTESHVLALHGIHYGVICLNM